MRHVGKLVRILVVLAVTIPGCSNDDATNAANSAASTDVTVSAIEAAGTSSTTPITSGPTSTPVPLASAQFCSRVVELPKGSFDFSNDERVAELTNDSSLSDHQRLLLSAAIADARTQIASGSGYSDDLLVEAINEICGTSLTTVTMTE
jgi:hypothetical protein